MTSVVTTPPVSQSSQFLLCSLAFGIIIITPGTTSYIKLELTRDRLRSLHFIGSILFYLVLFHSISFDFVTGGNVLLPHFLRRVLYRWLYSLCKSVM